jgi:hypothetical protein
MAVDGSDISIIADVSTIAATLAGCKEQWEDVRIGATLMDWQHWLAGLLPSSMLSG